MKRTPGAIAHRPELNRLPDYFGLPEGQFHALALAAFALWALSGFSLHMAMLAVALAVGAASVLVPLTRRDPRLPWQRLLVAVRFPRRFPAVTHWTLR